MYRGIGSFSLNHNHCVTCDCLFFLNHNCHIIGDWLFILNHNHCVTCDWLFFLNHSHHVTADWHIHLNPKHNSVSSPTFYICSEPTNENWLLQWYFCSIFSHLESLTFLLLHSCYFFIEASPAKAF